MQLVDKMKSTTALPVFLCSKSLNDQLSEIASFFKNELGADIIVPVLDRDGDEGARASTNDIVLTLFSLVENVSLTNKINQEAQMESLLNGVLTCVLLVDLAEETRDKLVYNLANKLADISSGSGEQRSTGARIRVLSTLFYGLDESSPSRYNVYLRLLELAAATSFLQRVPTDPLKVKEWIKMWRLDDSRTRSLWRILHAALLKNGENTKASKVMVELLKTFTLETANEAEEEAFQCAREAMWDPYAITLDHLLHLKPVQGLRGQPIFELLNIFVTGSVGDYVNFHDRSGDAVEKMGLDHEANLRKIRLLTFLNMCRGRQEVTHAQVEKELQLAPGDVEQFIIEALKTRLVSGKIDAARRRFRVTTCMEPSFSKFKWEELRQNLGDWQSQVRHMKRMLASVTNPDLA